MAGIRLDMLDIRRLLQMKQKGYSNREAAQAVGCSRNTVNGYVKVFKETRLDFSALLKKDDKDLFLLFPIKTELQTDRYQVLSGQFGYYQQELRKPGCTLKTLWKEYTDKNKGGYSYTQFSQHYRAWRGVQKGSGKLEHKAGEKLYIDFSGKKIPYIDKSTGEVKEAEVLVCILPCSQYTFAIALENQSLPELTKGVSKCLEYIGGAPKAIVSDNLKAAVTKAHKSVPVVNKTFKHFALHYGCQVDPTRPYRPQDKALVESAVKLVYQRIFYPLNQHQFFNISQINKAFSAMLTQYNDYRFTLKNTTRKKDFLDIEKSQLYPLPSAPYLIKTYKRAKVQKIGHIFLSEDKNYYSVPYRYIGKDVQVEYTSETVEVFLRGDRLAFHKRNRKAGHYQSVKDHLSSSHKAYSEWSLEYFQKRAKKIGPNTYFYITKLIEGKIYPETAYKQALAILAMASTYSAERLEKACHRAQDSPKQYYKIIENILKKGLETETLFSNNITHIPPHKNLRGPDQYR